MIYFLRCERDSGEIKAGWIKIGTSNRLSARLAQIAFKLGHKPTLLGVLDGGYAEEKAIHERFRGFYRTQEWFDPEGSTLLELIANEARPWDGGPEEIPDIRLRVDAELRQRIQKAADQEGNPVAAFIRTAIVRELRRREKESSE